MIKREDCTCRPSELQRPQSVQSSKIYPECRQGTEEWLLQRVGKITSSQGPYLIGHYGCRLFQESWDCIQKCIPERARMLPNFERGKQFESEAAKHFKRISDIKLAESPFIPHRRDANYGAMPDRIFYIIRNLIEDESVKNVIELKGKIILEIKTRALGYPEPLTYINGSHVVQCMIKMYCLPDVPGCLLLSYVPENKRFSLFLIKRDEVFIKALKNVCNGILKQENISILFLSESIHSNELCNSVLSKIPNFENILPLRQWANNIAARSPKVQLTPIVLND